MMMDVLLDEYFDIFHLIYMKENMMPMITMVIIVLTTTTMLTMTMVSIAMMMMWILMNDKSD